MRDVEEIVSGLEQSNPMVEAVRGAFGSIFGVPPRKPISPLVDWIVATSALPRTQVDNYVRSRRNDPVVDRAISGDIASRCDIMKKIATALGTVEFDGANTVQEILDAAKRNADALVESRGFRTGGTPIPRGVNRKPKVFCRAPKTRVPPRDIPKSSLEEWLVNRCGLPGDAVNDYLAGCAGDETVRLAREGDTAARYELAKAIGTELGIPSYVDASTTAEIMDAARKNRERPVDESAENPGNPLVETVEYREGHKDSDGDDAPWVIVSCQDGRILSSHKSKKKAEEHLGQMEYFKHIK